MVGLVARMLDLHTKLAAEQAPHVKTVLQRQIEATDRLRDTPEVARLDWGQAGRENAQADTSETC
jgi:hypothetical protein